MKGSPSAGSPSTGCCGPRGWPARATVGRPAIGSRRPRKAQAGLLVLWDGSPQAWLSERGPHCCLVGALDDATGHLLPGAAFVPAEDTVSYLRLLRTLVGSCGIPVALYMDRHGIFQRHDEAWTLAEELRGRQDPTQVGRALEALGIEAIYALSPQAKGQGPLSGSGSPASSASKADET